MTESENREQRAESRDQRAEIRDQRAEIREQATPPSNSPIKTCAAH
jgi:hypothetical protein